MGTPLRRDVWAAPPGGMRRARWQRGQQFVPERVEAGLCPCHTEVLAADLRPIGCGGGGCLRAGLLSVFAAGSMGICFPVDVHTVPVTY